MTQPQSTAGENAAQVNVVLIHGAFADGSGWSKIIPLLEYAGYNVTAVQNPLTSFADDIATTKRVIDAQAGSVVVVGHSYGGAVMTVAASGNPNVKALVYIAAFAPDAGATITAGSENFAPPQLLSVLAPDAAGFLYIDRSKFHEAFAADVPTTEARIMAATQKPLFGAIFGATVENAAWRNIPSWYLVAAEDHAINPDYERFLAKRMGATTTEVQSSHVPFVSQPDIVFQVINDAVKGSITVTTP